VVLEAVVEDPEVAVGGGVAVAVLAALVVVGAGSGGMR
jgi:hypothetical protein